MQTSSSYSSKRCLWTFNRALKLNQALKTRQHLQQRDAGEGVDVTARHPPRRKGRDTRMRCSSFLHPMLVFMHISVGSADFSGEPKLILSVCVAESCNQQMLGLYEAFSTGSVALRVQHVITETPKGRKGVTATFTMLFNLITPVLFLRWHQIISRLSAHTESQSALGTRAAADRPVYLSTTCLQMLTLWSWATAWENTSDNILLAVSCSSCPLQLIEKSLCIQNEWKQK